MRVIHKIAAAGATMVALAGIGVGTAMADPYATPATTDIVGVGSDTLTPLYDGGVNVQDAGTFVTDYNATSPSSKLWSWDAVNGTSTTITPKPGCATITRPNGSSAGITALNNDNTLTNGVHCIDYARSSRPPKTVVSGTNGPDAFAVLAGDAITWTSPSGSNSPVPSTLTVAQLKAIYLCTDTNWNQVGGSNAPIVAVLPQNGSGTRATFLGALGGSINTPITPGPCVVNGSNSTGPIEENTGVSTSSFGNTAQFDPSGVPAVDDVFPYSIGDYIAQGSNEGTYSGKLIGGHTTPDFGHGVMVMHNTTDSGGTVRTPTVTDSTAPYSNATVINPSFTSQLQRTLYNVVRNAGTATAPAFPTSPAYEANLSKIFGSAGWVCTSTAAQSDLASYGFTLRGRNCGALTAGS